MLCLNDIHTLITYCTIVESFFVTLSVSGLLYLRYKQPNITRPIRVNLAVPVTFVIICIFLLILPCYEAPFEVGMGVLITVSGIPAYYFGVYKKEKPQWYNRIMREYYFCFFLSFSSSVSLFF